MKRSMSVLPSLCPILPLQERVPGLLLCAGLAGGSYIDRLLHAWCRSSTVHSSNAGSATFTADVGS